MALLKQIVYTTRKQGEKKTFMTSDTDHESILPSFKVPIIKSCGEVFLLGFGMVGQFRVISTLSRLLKHANIML